MKRTPSPWLYAAALGTPIAVAALLGAFREDVPGINAVLVLVLVVVGVGAWGSRLAGVLAALSCTAWFDFFLIKPYLTFTIADRDDVETAILLTVVGLGVTEIALWGRRQQARSSEREGYLTGVLNAAGMVATGDATPRVVLDFIGRQIVDVLRIDKCEYVAGPLTARPRITHDGSVQRDGHVVDVDRSGLPSNDVTELPVQRGGTVLGRFVLTASSRTVWPSLEQRLVAVTLADQAAAVLADADRQS